MEQITHPNEIIREAERTLPEQSFSLGLTDPEHAWARLTPAEVDPVSLQRHNIVTQSPNPTAEPFDQLRTRILQHMAAQGHRKLALTSPTPGCGSSTIVANLALSLARHTDLRVMVFDLDLRSPSLIHMFGLTQTGPRFSALAGHRRNFDSTCLRYGSSLGLSLNASPIEDATEHLASTKTRNLLDYIDAEYAPDLMVFDLPSLRPSDAALAGLSLVDCALLIGHADRSTLEDIDWAERQIADTCEPLGVVLNRCRFAEVPGASFRG
ncbi:Mrp family chromosome partitioning ATPase [Litoreibacter ponti]|uniref:Mrp family chromosome partitioning ATPase n=1 Tax=Litoreibacter ponti TaxID=1510457 RepID=A0A2T6BPC0_9RHOB|nr:exopolysaccharide biosynthesis protein [Litoreibacter ponti]PTX57930.1 Mrp family chromosome partitioning ATPase [Litoreibacter ponti]